MCSRMRSTICRSSKLETPHMSNEKDTGQLWSLHMGAFQTQRWNLHQRGCISRWAMEPKKPDTEVYVVNGALCIKVKRDQIDSAMSEVRKVASGEDTWALMEHPLYSASWSGRHGAFGLWKFTKFSMSRFWPSLYECLTLNKLTEE